MGNFSGLPSELQIHIFRYLSRIDLKAVRGVCRKFDSNASPALFKRAVACARYQALGALQKISLHPIFCNYVKEIVFDGSVYNGRIASDEKRYHQLANECEELAYGFFAHRRQRYTRYRRLWQEQESMRQDLVLLHSIGRALEWLPNVSSIIYSPGPHHLPVEAKEMRDLLPRGVAEPHPYIGSGSSLPESQHGIHHLIGAIHIAQYTGVREFRIEHSQGQHGTEFTIYAFSFPDPHHLEAGKFFFSRLNKLQLHISPHLPDDEWVPTRLGSLDPVSNLATLLAETMDLEEFTFNICHWQPDPYAMYAKLLNNTSPQRMFISIGLGLTWPKLRCLSLGGIYTDEKDLISLVNRHNHTLVKLAFSYCSLLSGSWANIVDHVLLNTAISSFILHRVNEVMVHDFAFQSLSKEQMNAWQYEGRLRIENGGHRYFVSAPIRPPKPS